MTDMDNAAPIRRPNPRIGLRIRRTIAVTLVLTLVLGLYWIVFHTQLFAPLLAYVEPVEHGIAWVKEDPMRLAYTAAALIIPHIGFYMMIFGDD